MILLADLNSYFVYIILLETNSVKFSPTDLCNSYYGLGGKLCFRDVDLLSKVAKLRPLFFYSITTSSEKYSIALSLLLETYFDEQQRDPYFQL